MESVKWFLFHYHVVTFFIELTLNNLIVPLVFLPSAAVYCNGFLLDLGIPFKVVMYISDISFIVVSTMTVLFVSFHGIVSSVILIVLRKPYRDFTWNNSLGRCIANSRNKISDQSVRPKTVTVF
ncbi:hypothetical protein B9Z55_018462 [Caenorhabditis nigoni]|uniref:Uncharacterized protein n=1 Tax=Caenorhabditis nigoni TaxID=1611254 RepID=A0A2G5TE20_9PELO|nr:hypothetical protein B9Z55_018462 [Caenorhabditis nigoni]